MSEPSSTSVAAANPPAWNADDIFWLLGDPSRRRVLLALAGGASLAASQLHGGARLRLDATIKHLTRLAKAGLLKPMPDQRDKRRMLYSLSPAVTVVKTATGTAIDFGCCMVVCAGKIRLADVQQAVEPGGKD